VTGKYYDVYLINKKFIILTVNNETEAYSKLQEALAINNLLKQRFSKAPPGRSRGLFNTLSI
jgi:hypothetical protein